MTTVGPDTSTPLGLAYTFLGVHETGGPNRGPLIDEWLRGVWLEPDNGPPGGYPWCAAFVTAMCKGGGRPLRGSALVAHLYDANRNLWLPQGAQLEPGDVCIHLEAKGGHCGFFVEQGRDGVTSLDGNTNAAGSREGTEVAIKVRHPDYWHAFMRPVVA